MVGLDRSGAMLAVARAGGEDSRSPVGFVHGDGAALPFAGVFDAVFSAATLHWIHDHPAVFRSVATALAAGGRFVAQCGGKGNLQRMLEHAEVVMALPAYREHFAGWRDPWNFADAETTASRLDAAGLTAVETWLEEAPVDLGTAERYADFVSCVCIRHHLERLPLGLRAPFTQDADGARRSGCSGVHAGLLAAQHRRAKARVIAHYERQVAAHTARRDAEASRLQPHLASAPRDGRSRRRAARASRARAPSRPPR